MLSRPSLSEGALRLCCFGSEKNTFDLLVYSPHGTHDLAATERLWDAQCQSELDISLQVMHAYCRHEADLGANEVAEQLCQHLSELRPDCHIGLLCFELPRGLLDINRYPEHATPEFYQRVPPANLRNAMQIHSAAMQRVLSLMQSTTAAIHVHTMASHDGVPEHALTPEDIRLGLDRHDPGFHSGPERPYNIFLKNELGQQISHHGVSHALLQRLTDNGIRTAFDEPYQPHSHYPGTAQMKLAPSLAVDIPKSLLATPATAKTQNPTCIEIDPECIAFHGKLMAEVVAEHWLNSLVVN